MNRSIFNPTAALAAALFSLGTLCAAEPAVPAVPAAGNETSDTADTPRPALAQRRHADYTGWARLTPTHAKLQYAGGMGLASLGLGWDYGRNNRWETDLHFGWVPKRCIGSEGRATFTLKQNYIPWNIRCHEQFGIEPFACGLYLNFISGSGFWLHEPTEKYGGGYYRFSTRMRAYLYFGQRATWYHRAPNSCLRSISLYYELSAKELDLIAKTTNRTLSIPDIFYFSFGIRMQLMKP